MSDCLNPDCVTDYPVLSWLDPDYCCDACRRVHGPISVKAPDPVCARPACGQPIAISLDGYCSDRCVRLDTPAPVEAWAAAMGQAIDGMEVAASQMYPVPPPPVAVEPLTPVPAGADTPEPLSEPQGATLPEDEWAEPEDDVPFVDPAAWKEVEADVVWVDAAADAPPTDVAYEWPTVARRRFADNPRPVPRRWWARLLRRTA